jgi:hypothetical protein
MKTTITGDATTGRAQRARTRPMDPWPLFAALVWTLLFGACAKPSSTGAASAAASGAPVVAVRTDESSTGITFFSWDTEGGDKAATNLLRQGSAARLQFRQAPGEAGAGAVGEAAGAPGAWTDAATVGRRVERPGLVSYQTIQAGATRLDWRIETRPGGVVALGFYDLATAPLPPGSLRLLVPFDPKVTPTTVLPAEWLDDGTFRLPAVVNAPDWGPMLLTEKRSRPLVGRLEGSRSAKTVDLVLEFPDVAAGQPLELGLEPLILPPPEGLAEASRPMWLAARRGWLNALQPCARWGEQDKPFSAPAGVLGNNVISDPASLSVWFYADQAFFMPQIAPGLSVMPLLRRTIDYWLERRMRADAAGRLTGEVTGYWDYGGFLDAEASLLIAAWDYVESTGDEAWLRRRLDRLELMAEFLARRDVDDDGFVEATQSGDPNTLQQPDRSDAWWDALNCGYKDGYVNALIYRGWRDLADLETKLGRAEKAAAYTRLADRLKGVYIKVLFNDQTGWLGWWRGKNGTLHDYESPTLNGLAVEYGLIIPDLAREVVFHLWQEMAQVGFRRFDLGVPPMLVPVLRSDYLQPNALGLPTREDGSDTFGYYMNGGITAGHVLHFLMAHYVLGDEDMAARADMVLNAMLERQKRGGFQNGVRDATFEGIDWTTWDGKPSGYEGYLADSFRFLQAVLMRQPELRAKLERPLMEGEVAGKAEIGEDLAFLEQAAKDVLSGCVREASDGTPLFTPDGRGNYPALWTRDFASMVEYAGDLMPAENVERCIDYLVRGIREDGAVPDRVQVDGRPVYAAGSPEDPLGEPNLDNGPFLVFAAASGLDRAPEERRPNLLRRWLPALLKGMDYVPLASSGLVWNDPARPHSPYGFTDTVGKTGELFMESLLYWRAARILAGWEREIGASTDMGRIWEERAAAVEKNIGSLWDDRTGMFLAASGDCRQTDIWGNAFAIYYGFPLGGKADRIVDWLAANVAAYAWHGQIRHLPAGEYWQRQLLPGDKDRYQNGAYWAAAAGWVIFALDRKSPELARRLLHELVADFRSGGVCECVSPDGTRKLPSYVNSATNPLGAARRILGGVGPEP